MKRVFAVFSALFALNAFAATVVLTHVIDKEDVEAGVSSERSCSVWSNHQLVTEVEVYDLIEQLRHSDWKSRVGAAEALGILGPAAGDAVPVLREVLLLVDNCPWLQTASGAYLPDCSTRLTRLKGGCV